MTENNEMISSSIQNNDSRAQMIRNASVITWDEAPMANKAVLSTMEDVCRTAMGNDEPFGGKVVVLLGDFRQTCPVVRKGSKKDAIDASIKSSPLWPLFRTVHLPQLIRNAEDPDFATFINDIGDGTESSINLDVLLHAHSPEELIDFVFPREVLLDPMRCLTRSILAPTNDQIDHYNDKLVSRLPGDSRTYFAADTIRESDESNIIPPASILDYNRKRPPRGIPPATLTIKVGMMCRIMRNFSIDRGLVKNARVIVTDIGTRLITIRVLPRLPDNGIGEDILLPRITFTSQLASGHTLMRRQFPLTGAYATTFNSCQGLTLDRMGADLTKPVFSHGQLYTALSRIRNRQHGMVLLPRQESNTANVTYLELLD